MIELNKVYNYDVFDFLKLIPDEFVDLIIVDPPYNVSNRKVIKRNNYGGRDITYDFGEWDYFETDGKYIKFIGDVVKELYRVAKSSCSLYMWLPRNYLSFIEFKMKKVGWQVRSTLVWCKTNPIPQVLKVGYMSSTEFCTFATKNKGRKHFWNIENGQKQSYFIKPLCGGAERTEHPTQKRLDITKEFIINSSRENDIVLDCFCGSGTTGVAAIELNRNYLLNDFDEKWVKLSEERIKNAQYGLILK